MILYGAEFDYEENLERLAGIEPASSAWHAEILPLKYSRESGAGYGIQTRANNLEGCHAFTTSTPRVVDLARMTGTDPAFCCVTGNRINHLPPPASSLIKF